MAFTNSQWIVQVWWLSGDYHMICLTLPCLSVQLHYAFQDKDNLYMVMDYMPGE